MKRLRPVGKYAFKDYECLSFLRMFYRLKTVVDKDFVEPLLSQQIAESYSYPNTFTTPFPDSSSPHCFSGTIFDPGEITTNQKVREKRIKLETQLKTSDK